MLSKHDVVPFAAGVAVCAVLQFLLSRRRALTAMEEDNVYETDALVDQYLVFHYGKPKELLRYDFGPQDALEFPKRVAEECFAFEKGESGVSRALDIGCAVGRSVFELARDYKEVVGIDFSHRFIAEGNHLKEKGSREYQIQDEGRLGTKCVAEIDPAIDRSRTHFQWGDACNLPESLGQFGAVLAANLICRLPDPRKFLRRCATLVAPGGVLVIASPYTYMEEFTPRDLWIGGYTDANGKAVYGFDTLKEVLGTHFELVGEKELQFFIRETAHKNQWSVSHITAWKRKKVA